MSYDDKFLVGFLGAGALVMGSLGIMFGGSPDIADAIICNVSDMTGDQCLKAISPTYEIKETVETTKTVQR